MYKYLLQFTKRHKMDVALHKKCPYSEFFWSVYYPVNLRIQSTCGKIWTTENSEYGHYSSSVALVDH